MENFIVSARKYRPVTFNTVVGQGSITGTLKKAIRNNQLAQAFLFCGPRGVGKTTCARILAKTINCLNPTADTEPCNECSACKAFNDSSSFNIHELDAASNNSVDDIRSLVEQVRIPPQMGKYKVYIIDEVHMLSPQAFNAFLKTLEEPPAYAKFILATTEKHKIIPTILSRCQIFDFRRITVDDIASHLSFVAGSEGVTADPEALHIIAHKADGALRDALSVFDQMVNLGDRNISRELVIDNLNVLDYEYYFRVMDFMSNGNIRDTLLLVNEVIEKGFDGQHFITGLGEHLRNLLMGTEPETVRLIETSDAVRGKYIQQSRTIPMRLLADALDIINKCDVTYRNSNNKRLSLEVPLIQICRISGKTAIPETPYVPAQPAETPKPAATAAPAPAAPAAAPRPQSEAPVVPDAIQHDSPTPAAVPVTPVAQTMEKTSIPAVAADEKPAVPAAESPDVPVQSHHRSSISIKSVTQSDKLASAIVTEVRKERTAEYTGEQLVEALNRFAELKKEDSALYYTALTTFKPVLSEGDVLQVTVGNTVLEKEFNERKNSLLEYLRDQVQNDRITLSVTVTDQPVENKKYLTDKEKMDIMESRNANVADLRNQLNLELDL
jgi:DNA polymerase III subunit gamma/tau